MLAGSLACPPLTKPAKAKGNKKNILIVPKTIGQVEAKYLTLKKLAKAYNKSMGELLDFEE